MEFLVPKQTAKSHKCSFCGKGQEDVRRLIAGPGTVYICDECVELCQEIIEEDSPEYRAAQIVVDDSIRANITALFELDQVMRSPHLSLAVKESLVQAAQRIGMQLFGSYQNLLTNIERAQARVDCEHEQRAAAMVRALNLAGN